MAKNKIVVVAGASSELGKALIKKLSAECESNVLATVRKPIPEQKKVNGVKYISNVDLTIPDDLKIVIEEIESLREQRIHIVLCAGYFPGYKKIINLDIEEARKTIESNFISAYNVAYMLLPIMIEREGGQFIVFTSHSRYQAFPLMSAFECSMAALEQLVKQIANEYSKNDICANAIALATMMTNAELDMKPFGDHQHWLKPEEVAEFVVSMIKTDTRILNGNVHDLFHYSDSYFHDSYFQRVQGNKREKDV